jgi:hypothetical protein
VHRSRRGCNREDVGKRSVVQRAAQLNRFAAAVVYTDMHCAATNVRTEPRTAGA